MINLLCLTAMLAAAPLEPADTLPEPPQGKTWELVWHDEFDGDTLDASKWESPEYERRGHLWRAANAYLDRQGRLVLETSKVGGRYASPCVRTADKYEKAFGYFVTRCKLPTQEGHWSAFWMINSAIGNIDGSGRDGTEIDIMVWPWRDGRIQHTLHWDGYGDAHRMKGYVSKRPEVLDGRWHTFALWWTPDEYRFYVDGGEVWRTNAGGVCQNPVYLKLSEEIGDWAGDIAKAQLPDYFTVDYVRVYDLANEDK